MYKHILVATDGSELANRALTHAIDLATIHKAQLTVVTVTEPWSSFDLGHEVRMGAKNPIANFEAAAAAAAKRVLDGAEQTAKAKGVACELVHVQNRHPAEGIIEAAQEKGCDLIVMASHGRRGVERLLLGSQAYEVLTHSKVPALIVR
jgi:nucleotide-binding universal stress UspA family protein